MDIQKMVYRELQRKLLRKSGYSRSEISAILNLKQAVSSRISHAKRKAIRKIIEGGDDD